mgnify:CR=1 FL=1
MFKKIQYIITIGFLLLFFGCNNTNQNMPIWYKGDIASAQLQLQSNQLIMIKLYSDWWKSCKLLDANTLSNENFQSIANENLICIKINKNTEVGKKLYDKYNANSLPYLIFLDKNLNLIANQSGFINAIELNHKITKLIAEL